MRALSVRMNWCALWPYASVPFAHASMRISFPNFQMFILYTLSMRVRNICVHWACTSETDAFAEHTRQELMRALSTRVRNWFAHFAFVSGINVCTECSPFKTCWAFMSGADEYPERTLQELMCALSMRVRNWCVLWACTSVFTCMININVQIPFPAPPPQKKISSLYFNPKFTYPERLHGVKIIKIRGIKTLTLGHL